MERETRDIDEIKASGIVYRLSTVERYAKVGMLGLGNKLYSADDRINAAKRLFKDYYFSRLDTRASKDITQDRVDYVGKSNLSEKTFEARNRFNKAIKAIPHEFFDAVSKVVLLDEDINLSGKSERQRSRIRHTFATMLCLGLDRLIEFYWGKGKF